MSFVDLSFIPFFACMFLLIRALPWSLGRWLLIGGSYFFYGAAHPWYCLLLGASTVVDYWAAIQISDATTLSRRKLFLVVSVVTNMSMLCVVKYSHFVADNLNVVFRSFNDQLIDLPDWVLPAGISFYTFQTMCYTIEVYRGRWDATRDLATFAQYVAFFPQLMAGPIERPSQLIPQLAVKQSVTMSDLESGFQRILWGVVKKVVFADRFAIVADEVYLRSADASGSQLIVGTLCFAFQIYLDFSAYTDIAIGTARMLGVRLSENFDWPFFSKNPSEFWNRWHMTLSRWFRDYVYLPLGGRPLVKLLQLIGVMTLIGLWHGAAWNYVLFGLVWGVSLAFYNFVRGWGFRGRPLFGHQWWTKPIAILMCFVFLNITLVLFRSPDLETARNVYMGLFSEWGPWPYFYNFHLGLLAFVGTVFVVRGLRRTHEPISLNPFWRAALWSFLILLIIYGAVDQTQPYIYFEF